MLDLLNQHIVRKLVSFIVAFGLAFTFQQMPAGAGDDNKSCQPTVPHDLSPSEFEELRDALWETGNARELKLNFEMNFDFTDYPIFFLLISAKQIDRGKFIEALINLEVFEIASQRVDFCQYIFASEIVSALRYAAIKALLPEDTPALGSWKGFGHGTLRYFSLNEYEVAKCIILNARFETLKLDSEPAYKEYPRRCFVR